MEQVAVNVELRFLERIQLLEIIASIHHVEAKNGLLVRRFLYG